MKIITIGDIHGEKSWSKHLDKNYLISNFDKIVFIGDYVDSFYLKDHEIYETLLEIIEFKKTYPDNIVLLFGNHDIQYLLGTKGNGCTGYRPSMWLQLNELFTQNRNLFQLAFQVKNYLWTHSGVHKGWWKFNIENQKYVIRDGRKLEWLELDKTGTVADILNFCFEAKHQPIFDCGLQRGGHAKVGGPLWADKNELYSKPLDGYHQIVGHTRIKEIKHYNHYANKETSTTFIDCMHIDYDKYYIVEL